MEDPALVKMTPECCAAEFKDFVFALMNSLQIEHYNPGDRIIEQNQDVLDEFGDFLEDANMYYVITGTYAVKSFAFSFTQREISVKTLDNDDKSANINKILVPGDYFGEVSLLFGCRRTATVESTNYCECVVVPNEEFMQLMANYPSYKNFLVRNSIRSYDDEMRIFLIVCLRTVSYLQDLSDEILNHIAVHMIATRSDKDSLFAGTRDDAPDQELD